MALTLHPLFIELSLTLPSLAGTAFLFPLDEISASFPIKIIATNSECLLDTNPSQTSSLRLIASFLARQLITLSVSIAGSKA